MHYSEGQLVFILFCVVLVGLGVAYELVRKLSNKAQVLPFKKPKKVLRGDL